MAGEGEQVDLERVDVDRDFAGGLHGVGVEINIGFFGDAADVFEGLDGAEFVVSVHDGDEGGFWAEGGAQAVGRDEAVAIYGEVADCYAFFFEGLAGV